MTVRTLAEAAAEVLNGSRSSTPRAPMPKLADTGSGLDGVTDLGGASFEEPQGGDIGKRAAGMVGKAQEPKGPANVGDRVKSTKQGDEGVDKVAALGNDDVDLASSMNKTVKPKMQPTSEEVESEEEVIAEDTDEEELTEEEIEAARTARWEDLKERMKAQPVAEDMSALFSGETLSEEFKTKATTIFEAAVMTRAVAVAESLEKEILEAAEAAIEETRADLEEKVEGYLNFVVEQWVADNTVAIESGLRSEVVEGFISGLKNLFVEHYVDVPEDKVDVLAAQEEKINELTDKVNEAVNANIELTKKLNESKKKEILSTVCEGLTATQAEKVKALAEGVEFTAEGDYSKKLKVIRESYTNSSKVKDGVVALTEQAGPAEIEEAPAKNPAMDIYTQAISRTQK